MKYYRVSILLGLFLVLSCGFYESMAQEWSKAIYLSPGKNPDLVINPQTKELHIVAIVEPKGVVYLKTDKTGVKLDSLIVPNTQVEEGGMRFGPTIGVDSQDFPHIGFRDHKANEKYDIFYTRQTANGWTAPLKIAGGVIRGYVVRMAIDNQDFVHFAHGSLNVDWPNDTGPIHYYILKDGSIQFEQHNIYRIRADERFELDVSPNGTIDLVSGDYHYSPDPAPIYYWHSWTTHDSLERKDDLIHVETKNGPNGSPDLFVDAAGNTHVCYGAGDDRSIGDNHMSIRYCRIENGTKVFDVRVTDSGEISEGYKVPVGVASVAASEDGQKVIVAYMAGENGPLYVRFSEDGGHTWQNPQYIADGWNSVWSESRNKQIIRAYRSDFYIVYPQNDGIYLRYLRMTPTEPPIAMLNTPDAAPEGSTIMFDASVSYDPDGAIVTYHWDFQNDGIYDDTTNLATDEFTYLDEFDGEAKLKVFDDQGDTASVTVPITIYNVAPLANAGDTYTGNWYTPIEIHGTATDPGTLDTLTFRWDLDEDGMFETLGKDVQTSAYTKGDTHWVVLQVSDNDGGVDIDSALIVINNQPPVVGDIFDQVINEGENFTPISLDAFVDDPDNPDSSIVWSFLGLTNLTISSNDERVVTIRSINPDWAGSETVTFVATDPGGKSASDMAMFAINIVNNPPLISSIPGQTRYENQLFADIQLDNFVNDPDNPDSTLIWSYFGNDHFMINLVKRIASIAVVDSEWAGTDTIGFMVSDPQGLKDTASVTFTIFPINDAPTITKIEDQEIYQDQKFAPIFLDNYVFDPDYPDSLIQWTWSGNFRLELNITPERILEIYRKDSTWVGSEIIILWATDNYGLYDLTSVKFTVRPGIDVADSRIKSVPDRFYLHPNYPNPFNPSTWIQYDLAAPSHVILNIYNQMGHEVRTLVDQSHEPGSYKVMWDGRDNKGNKVSSGMYLYQIKAGNFIRTMKMLLIL